jgi:hypothetical protein
MANYQIREDYRAVVIEVADAEDELIGAFAGCVAGRCQCPTDEYGKVASMTVQDSGDSIVLRIETKPGAKLDTAQIASCLDYTTNVVVTDRRSAHGTDGH